MSIVAQCPHCETRFNLQAELNGKSMRCPNLECRQVFTVRAMEEVAPPEPPPPEPPPPKKPTAKPQPTRPAAKPVKPPRKPVEVEIVDAKVVEAKVIDAKAAKPAVKEVQWSEGAEIPPPAAAAPDAPAKKPRRPTRGAALEDVVPGLARRKKRGSRRPLYVGAMLVAIAAVVIFGVLYVLHYQQKQEEVLAEAAEGEYKKARAGTAGYGDAAKRFKALAADYPDSKNADRYAFFWKLSEMQAVVRAVGNRENYEKGVAGLRAFIEETKDAPLAKPVSGYGHDVLEAGTKLGEDVAKFADDRVKACRENRATAGAEYRDKNRDELKRADAAVAAGRDLVKLLDPFRGPDDPPPKAVLDALDAAEREVARERSRNAAVDRARADLAGPTDALISRVEADLAAASVADDPEAVKLVADAKGRLRGLVKWEDDPAAFRPPPAAAAASLLFVTPLGKPKPREPAPGELPTVFLCVARGILYAFEEDGGALLWAARVGPDVTDPPAVARVELAAGPSDLAVVTSNVGGAPAVSGYDLRTGFHRWYQPLPAPAAGPAVLLGTRAFVPVRDALGSVYEFDAAAGARVGYIRLGQPVADRGAAVRPGTNLLYVAADARRVYVLDAGGKDDDGNRVNPRCAQVVATGHLPGALRAPPLLVGPEGREPAERLLVLTQADGTGHTRLRAFAVGDPGPPPPEGAAVPETPAQPVAAPRVPGWVAFAPDCDGERLAVCTDAGAFRVFGVNQPGNRDKPLFPYPAPPPPPAAGPPPAADRPLPGLVISAEESVYWVVAAGQLQRVRLTVVPARGQDVVPAGTPVPVGEPVHAAQVNARRDTACLVVRALDSSGVRAVAFDLHTGEVRWQRQLGLAPARAPGADHTAAPFVQGDRFVLVDEEGGIFAVPAAGGAGGAGGGEALAAPAAWLLAAAPPHAAGPTAAVASADGRSVFTVTPVTRDGPKFLIRRVADGKLAHEEETVAPAALAGQPAVVGDDLLVPTADGFVNRYLPGDGRVRSGALVPGPAWQAERKPGAACAITPLSGSSFATSDGGKRLSRWDWPAGGKWNPAGAYELRAAAAGPGVVVPSAGPGGPPRLVVADASGSVWLFAADRAGPPLLRWRSGGTNVLPAGRPSSGFVAQAAAPGRASAVYTIDGTFAAAIDPDGENPLWVTRTGADAAGALVGPPQPAGDNRWAVTDLAGRVLILDGATGAELARLSVGLPGAVPAAAAAATATAALTLLSDGSAVMIELPKK